MKSCDRVRCRGMMRKWLFLILALVGQEKSIHGQAHFIVPNVPLSLEVHEFGTGDQWYTRWEDEYGGYDRDFHRWKSVVITLRDFSRRSPGADLSAYFIATPPTDPNGRHFIYDRTEGFIEFGGQLEWKRVVSARWLKARVLNLPLIGRSHASGADMNGWIVIGKSNGSTFGTYASSQKLLDIALGHGPESFDTMVANYEKAARPRNDSKVAANTMSPALKQINQPRMSTPVRPDVPATPSQTAVVNRKVQAQTPQGEIIIPLGTQVRVLGREGETLQISYMGWTVTIPAAATDLN